jgi:hypothetical protein
MADNKPLLSHPNRDADQWCGAEKESNYARVKNSLVVRCPHRHYEHPAGWLHHLAENNSRAPSASAQRPLLWILQHLLAALAGRMSYLSFALRAASL